MPQRWVVVGLVLAMAAVWAIVAWPAPEPDGPLGAAGAPAEPQPPLTAAAPPSVAAAPEEPATAPEAEREAPPSAAPAAAPSAPAAEEPLFEHDMGPVAELKQRFSSEPRESAASDAETLIRDAFKPADSPSPVFRSVLCRSSVCKLEVRMAPEQLGAYVAGMTRITEHFDKQLAVTRTAQRDGEVSLDVYVQRLAPAP